MRKSLSYLSLACAISALVGCIYLFVTYSSGSFSEQNESKSQNSKLFNLEVKIGSIYEHQKALSDSAWAIGFDIKDRPSMKAKLALDEYCLTIGYLTEDILAVSNHKSCDAALAGLRSLEDHIQAELQRAEEQKNRYVMWSAKMEHKTQNDFVVIEMNQQIKRFQSLCMFVQ